MRKEEEKDAAQAELDDLLIVFNDLEEKVAKYKVRSVLSSSRLIPQPSLQRAADKWLLSGRRG